jgi:hypothetical protein
MMSNCRLWAVALGGLAALVLVSGCGTPGTSGPTVSPSAVVAPDGQTLASDAATARSLVDRYEAACATGDYLTAWSVLAAFSQRVFPSFQSFAAERTRFFVATGPAYVVGEPRQDDPDVLAWLAKGQPVPDPGQAFSVEVTHPDAPDPALRREVFVVAPDTSGTWRLWIFV